MSALGNGFGWSGSGSGSNGSNGGADSSSSLGSFSSSSSGISGRLLAGSLSSLSGFSSGSGVSKAHSFNVRFLIKPKSENEDEESDLNEDEDPLESENEFGALASSNLFKVKKFSSEPNYEKLQLSAALFPAPIQGSSSVSNESDNYLVCVARRMPVTDNSPSNIGVEQFSTKLDLTGKIISIDTSGVSSTYSQYLNKDLVDKCILELCHPLDFQKVNAHLKETLSKGNSTISSLYRLKVSMDKYVLVQTKSKRFSCGGTKQNYISAQHSIIRDSESNLMSSLSNPMSNIANSLTDPVTLLESTVPHEIVTINNPPHSSNSTTSTITTTTITTTSSSLSSLTVSTPYPTFAPLSPSTNVVAAEYSLSDCLGLSDMFPSSSWSDYDTTNDQSVAGLIVDPKSIELNINTTENETSAEKMIQASTTLSSLQSPSNYTPPTTPGPNTNITIGSRQSPVRSTTPILLEGLNITQVKAKNFISFYLNLIYI